MLSIEEQKSIISKFVKINKNFSGNEDLFEDFCSESLQKSYMVFNSVSNPQKVESYISKVVHTSILKVLKDYGRVRRSNNRYSAVKEIKTDFSGISDSVSSAANESSYSETAKEESLPVSNSESINSADETSKQQVQNTISYDSSFVLELPDPGQSVEDKLITKECLQKIADSVCIIHKEVPSQQFLNIFYLRYIKSLKQSDIGKELGLSQAEVSKRLMRLSKLISNIVDGGRG